MITKLCEIAKTYHTDKTGWYTPFYSLLFEGWSPDRMLEVGIGTPESMAHVRGYIPGASLLMWRDYFPYAEIWGLDIDERVCKSAVPRIRTICSDSRDGRLHRLSLAFDLIVDDGDHDPDVQWETFQNLFPLLNEGGFYIIEDAASYFYLSDKLEGYGHQIVLCPIAGIAGIMGKLILVRK